MSGDNQPPATGNDHPATASKDRVVQNVVDGPIERIEEAGRKALRGARSVARAASLDRQRSRRWAIAAHASVGGGEVGAAKVGVFELVNLRTGRAHEFIVAGTGFGVAVWPVTFSVSAGPTSYAKFTTSRPMNFPDFDGTTIRLTTASALVGSLSYLTIWTGEPILSTQLAYVRMMGWEINVPGGDAIEGDAKVEYRSGERSGLVGLELRVESPPPERPPRHVDIEVGAAERARITVPSDVLFDFDSAAVRPDAIEALQYLADLLNRRRSEPVDIEGHTDSIGSPEYNMKLSRRRAEAVKKWFIDEGVLGAENFKVRAYGETQPVAPNTNPDESDNPEGRKKNRRVTIRATWNL